jgi:hypothetical protein
MVVYEITYQLNSQVQYAESQLIVPIIGIANALIQVRVGLRRKTVQTQYTASVASAPVHFSQRDRVSREEVTSQSQVMELKSVAI